MDFATYFAFIFSSCVFVFLGFFFLSKGNKIKRNSLKKHASYREKLHNVDQELDKIQTQLDKVHDGLEMTSDIFEFVNSDEF